MTPLTKVFILVRYLPNGFDIFKILMLYFVEFLKMFYHKQRKFSAKIIPHYAILIEPNNIFAGHDDCVFEIPQVPFAFVFESERPNGNSATKHSLNYHSSDLDTVGQMAELQFGENSHRITFWLFD